MLRRGRCAPQSPAPGFGEKYGSLSGFPSHSLESGGGAFLTIIFGQIFAYSAFSDSHFSSPGSVSGLIASTGHSGTQTPQSMHSSGWLTSMFSPSSKESTGHTSTQSMILQRIQLSLTTKVNEASFQQIAVVNSVMVSVRLEWMSDQIPTGFKRLDGLCCGAAGCRLKFRECRRGPRERVGTREEAERHPLGRTEFAVIALSLYEPSHLQQKLCRFAR